MPRILVNGTEHRLDPACVHWGEALEQLDRRAAGDGRMLTAVRFDGVDQPSFRDAAYDRYGLGDVALVEADSDLPHELLERSVDEAIDAARGLADAAERLGTTFRGFDVSYANQDLVEFAQGLGTLVGIVQALSQALGVGLELVRSGPDTAMAMIEQLSEQTGLLIDAQEAEDWITVADVIEYDIAPALQRWPGLFESLRTAIPRTSPAS
jgi:hypothetical protein